MSTKEKRIERRREGDKLLLEEKPWEGKDNMENGEKEKIIVMEGVLKREKRQSSSEYKVAL